MEAYIKFLLGKKWYRRKIVKGEGEWKVAKFHSLVFNDGTDIFVSCSAETYNDHLQEIIEKYEYYKKNMSDIDYYAKKMINHDNINAEHRKLPKLEFIRTRVDKDGFVVVDYYLIINKKLKLLKTYKDTDFYYFSVGNTFKGYLEKTWSFVYK